MPISLGQDIKLMLLNLQSNIIALEVEIQQKEELRLEFEQKVAELERQKNVSAIIGQANIEDSL